VLRDQSPDFMMRPLLIALLAAAGLAAGPVLRAVIIGLSAPPGEPWRRACPDCGAPAGWRAAVRLAAGRCAGCRARLGPGLWSVEAAAATLPGLLAAVVHPGLVLAAVCLLAVCVIPLAFIDLAVRRLPDVLTGPAYGVTALFLLLAAVAGGDWSRLGRALLGGAAFAGFCLLLFLISPQGIGPGDGKLAASLGTALAWFGWAAVFGGALAGFLLAALYSTGLLVSGRAARKQQIAFGPFMITGALLVILVLPLPGFLPQCSPWRAVQVSGV
jgi:leader peptidase (prepilin peptidase)/N-methyltransferase